jgi:hypothetical protein
LFSFATRKPVKPKQRQEGKRAAQAEQPAIPIFFVDSAIASLTPTPTIALLANTFGYALSL